MRDLTGTTAATEKDKTAYAPVFLVKVEADRFEGTASQTLRYASEKITLGADTYLDCLEPNGISIGWWTLRSEGGLAQRPDVSITIKNEELEHSPLDEYWLANDDVTISVVFATGSEGTGDILDLWHGVVQSTEIRERTWIIRARSNATTAWTEVPTRRVTLEEFPFAPLSSFGRVLPVNLGKFTRGALPDTIDNPPFVAPTLPTAFDQWHAGERNKDTTVTQVLEYWPSAGRWADVAAFGTWGEDSNNVELDDTTPYERVMFLFPVVAGTNNTVAGWRTVADRNKATPVLALVNTDVVEVFIEGSPTLGNLSALELLIDVSGSANFDWDISLNGVSKHSATGATADVTQALAIADHNNGWTFEGYVVQVTANATMNLDQIRIKATFNTSAQRADQPSKMYLNYEGRRDNTTFYNPDGASNPLITALSNTTIEKPLHMLEYILRATDMLNLDADRINLSAFDDPDSLRDTWVFATSFTQPVDPQGWLNEFCYQAGLDLFENHERKWTPSIRDTDKEPDMVFFAADLALREIPRAGAVNQWTTGISVRRLVGADIVTDIHLRYNQNRMTGEYQSDIIESGRFLKDGTCTITGATKKLVDGSAAFQSEIAVGWKCYFDGADDVNVVAAIDSNTQIELTDSPGDQPAGTRYWIGPGLNKTMFLAARRYKSDLTLGQQETSLTRRGGYTSSVIGFDDTTAQAVVDHWVDWLSQAWQVVEFTVHMEAVAVELGDIILIVNPWVIEFQPESEALTAFSGPADTTFEIASGFEDGFSVGDYAFVDEEVVKISSISAGILTVERGKAGTDNVSHLAGAIVTRISRTYRVIGIRYEPPHRIRIRAQQTPYNKDPVGVIIYVTQTLTSNTSYTGPVQIASGVTLTVDSGVTMTVN